jgi:HEXXH motif-containing protein
VTVKPAGSATPRPIRVTGRILDDLGGGPSSPATVTFLRSAQLAKHLQLLLLLIREAPGDRRAMVDESVSVLAAAREADPAAVNHLLTEPFVGAWLASAIRHRATGLDGYLNHLPALAVAAGVRAGTTGELTVLAHRGYIYLPGIGRAPARPAAVPVAFERGRIDSSLEPIRSVSLGDDLVIDFEDTDPHRACYHAPASPRSTAADVDRWRVALQEAWALLSDRAPEYAAELATGLRAVVPLVVERGGPDVSATSRIAFGAVAMSLPRRPDHTAATLVHEFQHSKLSALLDLIPLQSGDTGRRYFAPWRRDARPVGGLLQGAYAFLAVGDLWRRFGVMIDSLDASDRNYADLCAQLGDVLATLRSADSLNDDGRRVVSLLTDRFDTSVAAAVPPGEAGAAQARLARLRETWTAFNFGH